MISLPIQCTSARPRPSSAHKRVLIVLGPRPTPFTGAEAERGTDSRPTSSAPDGPDQENTP
jgi:hypothetical protein